MRVVAQQTLLQWDALVGELLRSGPDHRTDVIRVGRWLSRASRYDDDLLREVRAAGPAYRPVVCRHVPGSPGTRRRVAVGGVRWTEALFRALRRLRQNDIAACREKHQA